MAVKGCLLLVLVALLAATLVCSESIWEESRTSISRKDFPDDFLFGTATASYQIEGAWNVDGRGPSIWDNFTREHPEKIADRSNGDVATKSYYLYKTDVSLTKGLGMDAYRFSISWSRILPKGNLRGGINKAGIQYYKNLIQEIKAKGLQPFATIFHWDAPQALDESYGGFLSPQIIADYVDFAEVCFQNFGDDVKYWITLNEPWALASNGYSIGIHAPGRCSGCLANCEKGNSSTEPYIVTHHLLLAHANTVHLYRTKYQARQNGQIGIAVVSHWFIPYDPKNEKDVAAARNAVDYMLGWYMDPISRGDYPEIMKTYTGDRLPKFTESESRLLKGSYDFLGLNYYTTYYATSSEPDPTCLAFSTDSHARTSGAMGTKQIGPTATGSTWQYIYAEGFYQLLFYTWAKYNNPAIYITENGYGEANVTVRPTRTALNDKLRIDFHVGHLSALLKAINVGVNVKGYFAWSLMDNFEWAAGYTNRFGLYFVDFSTFKRPRTPKKSAKWFKRFLIKSQGEEEFLAID